MTRMEMTNKETRDYDIDIMFYVLFIKICSFTPYTPLAIGGSVPSIRNLASRASTMVSK